MKNQLITIIFFGLLISSCGTTTHYASSSYDDAIYYTPGNETQTTLYSATSNELTDLKNRTREASKLIKEGKIQNVIYVDENGNASIVSQDVDSSILDDSFESYEERICKFDSPVYVVNITFQDRWYGNYGYWNNPWYYGYSNPWRFRHYGYNPWYGPWSYYNPYYSFWGSPWNNFGYDYNPFYGYYGGYYGPYYGYGYGYYGFGNWYNGGWYNSNYHYNGGGESREIYYGRRLEYDGDSYGGRDAARSGGSYNRKAVSVERVRGGDRIVNDRYENSNSSRNQSIYRRDPSTGSSGAIHNTDVVNNSRSGNRTSTYQRSNSSSAYRQQANSQRQTVNRTSSPEYRKSTQTSESTSRRTTSSNSSSTNRNRSYESSSTPTRNQSYSTPVTRSSTSNNTSSGSSSSGGGERSSSGSGSAYRR